eukprot:scpid78684/ scgid32609/ 
MDRPAGMSRKSLSCVQCGRIEPGDGRLLHCFHVLCAGECLEKSLDAENTIKCARCGKVTKSSGAPEIDLEKSLPLASTYLYSSSGDADEQSRHPVEKLTESVNLCTACDEVATHVCEDCNASTPLPYCSEHATKHSSRVRAGVLHCPRAIVSRDGRRGEKDDASRAALADDNVCQLHTGKALQWWCEYCQCLLCERCKSTGHSQQHSVVSSEEAARAKLPILNRIVERFANTEERELDADTSTSTRAAAVTATLAAGSTAAGRRKKQFPASRTSNVLAEIDDCLLDIENQSEAASKEVCSHFKEFHTALEKREQEALGEIDVLRRQKEDRLRHQRNSLEQCQEDTAGIRRIASLLQRPCASSCDVLRLSDRLQDCAKQTEAELENQQYPCVQIGLEVDVDVSSVTARIIDAVDEELVVRDNGPDVAQWGLLLTDGDCMSHVGMETKVTVYAQDDCNLPPGWQSSSVRIHCRQPNGDSRQLEARQVKDGSDKEDNVKTAAFKPE